MSETCSISDYIREFTTLMLEIEIFDRELLFHFKDNMKDWVKVELDRHDV